MCPSTTTNPNLNNFVPNTTKGQNKIYLDWGSKGAKLLHYHHNLCTTEGSCIINMSKTSTALSNFKLPSQVKLATKATYKDLQESTLKELDRPTTYQKCIEDPNISLFQRYHLIPIQGTRLKLEKGREPNKSLLPLRRKNTIPFFHLIPHPKYQTNLPILVKF